MSIYNISAVYQILIEWTTLLCNLPYEGYRILHCIPHFIDNLCALVRATTTYLKNKSGENPETERWQGLAEENNQRALHLERSLWRQQENIATLTQAGRVLNTQLTEARAAATEFDNCLNQVNQFHAQQQNHNVTQQELLQNQINAERRNIEVFQRRIHDLEQRIEQQDSRIDELKNHIDRVVQLNKCLTIENDEHEFLENNADNWEELARIRGDKRNRLEARIVELELIVVDYVDLVAFCLSV
ncbi:hypothetical protein RSOL_228910, partial [Rhizoctonia solani AG-3 Rhs1AP]